MKWRLLLVTAASFCVGADRLEKEAEKKPLPTAPTRVTVVSLPDEPFVIEFIDANPTPKLRLTCGKITIEGSQIFLGDGKVARLFEALPEGIHIAPTSGKKGFIMGGRMSFTSAKGSLNFGTDYMRLDELKPGSVYVIAPYLHLKWTETPKK